MADAVKVGIRVVRGIDWEWADQDGGEGHVGTVVEVGGQGSSKNPSGTVVVIWDSGIKANYRAGYDYKDDLRVLDNAPAGICHSTVTCDECKQAGLVGYRWKCSVCYDYDLCQYCYMADKHDISHAFFRIDTPYSQSIRLDARKQSSRTQAKGLYVGAKVERAAGWEYGDQDGGAGKKGTVVSVGNAVDGTSCRSWVKVKWDSGITNDYRRAHEGKVDVKYTTKSNGELFYDDHLAKLEDYLNNIFQVGDFVRLIQEVMSSSQKDQMSQAGLSDATGRVEGYGDGARIAVSFQTGSAREAYDIPASYLAKTRNFQVGDTVKIIDNKNDLLRLQEGHGGINNQMLQVAGKSGRVVSVDRDGDVKVEIAGRGWLFNPQCCVLVSQSSEQSQIVTGLNSSRNDQSGGDEDEDDDDDGGTVDVAQPIANLMGLLLAMHLPSSNVNPRALVKEAAQGNVDKVRAIISRFPDQVDVKSEDLTALHVAAHGGFQPIVTLLLNAGVKSDITDNEGRTAVHYAIARKQTVILEMLLKKSTAAIDCADKNRQTALHYAVCTDQSDCLKVLLSYNCDVNKQDGEGDTALHDAINKNVPTIVDMLLDTRKVKFELQNEKGFNVIHRAALKGDHRSLTKMLVLAPQLVNAKKPDGFTALHVATLNGYRQVAEALIDIGKANLEITNSRSHTALLIAVSQGQAPLIELLVQKGANLEAEDGDGDTALHNSLLLMKNTKQATTVATAFFNVLFQTKLKNIEKAPLISKIHGQLAGDQNSAMGWLSVALFLVVKGANLDHKNRANETPLDKVSDAAIRDLLIKSKPKPTAAPVAAKPKPPPVAPKPSAVTKCMMCTTELVGVTFRPCGHSVACIECSSRMKQCFSCHEGIQEKVRLPSPAAAAAAKCLMCMTEPVGMTFRPCGHRVACVECSTRMKLCFSCHQPIQTKLRVVTGAPATASNPVAPASGRRSGGCQQQWRL